MKKIDSGTGHRSTGKTAAVVVLYLAAALIAASGAAFTVWAVVTGMSFMLFSVKMPGALLGLLTAYLGVRYIASVRRLSRDLAGEDAVFSWSNFRRRKSANAR